MSNFVNKWCDPEYFDSLANPAEGMENDLKAEVAQAVKMERDRIIKIVDGLLRVYDKDGIAHTDHVISSILEADHE